MKILELNRHVFVLLWILPTPNNKTVWFKRRNIILSISSLIVLVFGLIASICFVFKYVSDNLEASLFSLFQIAAFSSQIYLLIVGFILRSKFAEMFSKLQKIYDENKHLDKLKFMEKADKSAKFITIIFTKYVLIGLISSAVALAVFSAFYSIIQTHSIQVDQWYVPYKLLLPWNQKTVLGWITEMILTCHIGAVYSTVNTMFLSFFIGICCYHCAYCNHIQYLIAEFTHGSHNPHQSKLLLVQMIRFQNSAKEIFAQSAKLYSSCILIILISSMIFMACNMFQLDLAARHLDSSFVMMLIGIAISSSNMFLYCFFGQSASDAYLDISDCFYNANWTKLSPELQKYIFMMIANAQRPLYYHGFGVANLRLNNFLRMIKTVISYYMAFKALTT